MTAETKEIASDSTISRDRAVGALLGAAIGDALGWPQERPEFNLGKGSRQPRSPQVPFQEWHRKSGGRYQAYDEHIRLGEYSDDTQLILATARSLLRGKHWSGFFVRQELPVWLLYKRGAGRAVNIATKIWQNKKTPWQSDDDTVKSYFGTGANGAAMRVLPHALLNYPSEVDIQTQVMLNAVLTHGHPRAILGAMVYVQAAKFMLQVKQILSFGGLVEYLFDTLPQWSQMRQWEPGYATWIEAAQKHITSDSYEVVWENTIKELTEGLKSCQVAVNRGALASGRDFLADLGAFDKKVSGSGVVAALSAVYFASVYATDPVTGLLEAAFAHGADTDTIASMTGGLLGALLGTEWIVPEWRSVQDRDYIANLASQLTKVDVSTNGEESNVTNWDENSSNRLLNQLPARPTKNESQTGQIDLGPLGQANIIERFQWGQYTHKLIAYCWKLRTTVGQTIYITKVAEVEESPGITKRQTSFLTDNPINDKSSLSRILYSIQRVIPASLSANAAFILAADIAALLENEKRNLGKKEFKTRLSNRNYIAGMAVKVQEKGHPVHTKDLTIIIAKIGELLTQS